MHGENCPTEMQMGIHIEDLIYLNEYLLEGKFIYGDEGEEVNLKSDICGAQPI